MKTREKIILTPALWPAQAHIPTVAGRQIIITRGEGCYIYDTDGRRLFDGTAGLWHANVGHGRIELAEAAKDQMERLETYHIFGRFVNDQALNLADRLADMSPIRDCKVILNSGGADAIDVACKLARRHWQLEGQTEKTFILSREFAYHGLHGFGTSIAGLDFNREGYGGDSLIPETARIPLHDLAQTAEIIQQLGPNRIAALITEPIQGTGGVNPPTDGYLTALQKLCQENDILFILDEVITGFGRTGHMFAAEKYALNPDMIVFAKGVTSGYMPLGGVLVAPRVWQHFFSYGDDTPTFRNGATYAGHATACAVASRNLDILEKEGLVARAFKLENCLAAGLNKLREAHMSVADVRVAGFMGGITLADDVDAVTVSDEVIDLGFICRPLRGNTLQISPPFISTEEEVNTLVDAISTVLHGFEGR
jgi:adenosylmethionine-8-amino-7-oxononanoate aminotransferase